MALELPVNFEIQKKSRMWKEEKICEIFLGRELWGCHEWASTGTTQTAWYMYAHSWDPVSQRIREELSNQPGGEPGEVSAVVGSACIPSVVGNSYMYVEWSVGG